MAKIVELIEVETIVEDRLITKYFTKEGELLFKIDNQKQE